MDIREAHTPCPLCHDAGVDGPVVPKDLRSSGRNLAFAASSQDAVFVIYDESVGRDNFDIGMTLKHLDLASHPVRVRQIIRIHACDQRRLSKLSNSVQTG